MRKTLQARRVRTWAVWALVALAAAGVLASVGFGYVTYTYVRAFMQGRVTCLPSNFPKYPGSSYSDEVFELNGTYPGNHCHVVLGSQDDVATVTAFYQAKLDSGSWHLTRSNNPTGELNFQPARTATPFGTAVVAAGSPRTEITVDLFSSTCLPLGFPSYPAAEFDGQNLDREGPAQLNVCNIAFVSNDQPRAVMAFYSQALNTGNWQTTSSSPTEIAFRLRKGKLTIGHGTVSTAQVDDRTEINITAVT